MISLSPPSIPCPPFPGQPIGEYLYSIQAEIAGRAEEKAAATTGRAAAAAAATFTNATSDRIVSRLKRDRFLAIFAYLATRAAEEGGGSAGLDLAAIVEVRPLAWGVG